MGADVTDDADRPVDVREVIVDALHSGARTFLDWGERGGDGSFDYRRCADAVLAALSSAGLAVAPAGEVEYGWRKGGDRCDSGAAAGSEEPALATTSADVRPFEIAGRALGRALARLDPEADVFEWHRCAECKQPDQPCPCTGEPFVSTAALNAMFATLSAAGLAVVPAGEMREEWCVRRPDGALVRDSFTREQAEYVISYEETATDGIRGCELMRRTVHVGPWLPVEREG